MDFSYESIKERIKKRLQNQSSKTEGSFAMDVVNAISYEVAELVAMKVDTIVDSVMIDTATGFELDRKAAEFVTERNKENAALGKVKFSGTEGTVIYKGTILLSTSGVEYETLSDVVITEEGFVFADIKCGKTGAFGNAEVNTIITFKNSLNGVSSVVNEAPVSGGTDREKDDAFRERIIETKRRPVVSGNKNYYKKLAKEISGVLKAEVIPLANGPGTVKLILLSNNYDAVDSIILGKVKEHIEKHRLIGATVEVVSAIPKVLNIKATIKLQSGYHSSSIQEKLQEKMNEYIREIAFDVAEPLSFYKVGEILFKVPGVQDIVDYTVNGGKESLTQAQNEFFKLGEVLVNVS
ncbi:MAG: baseplate J/gp47 family protein [Bacillota bacterium]|nr:baseplate J/gp47 family protein [Bacillota bacterium]